jgi:hypothetical protein
MHLSEPSTSLQRKTTMNSSSLIATVARLAAIALFAADASAFYNPSTGGFLQRDPGAMAAPRVGTAGPAGSSQFIPRDQYRDGMNLYQYVRNNPVNRVDPKGLWSKDLHAGTTDQVAQAIGYSQRCREVLAAWNRGVDDWSGASLFPEYHFNFVSDRFLGDFRPLRGRDQWFQERWVKGVRKLNNAGPWYSWTQDCVYDGLAHIGESLHHRQDSFSHSAARNAEAPFDHAPSWVCLAWGDPLGLVLPRCRQASGADGGQRHPSWDNPHRPDDPTFRPQDAANMRQDTEALLRQIWAIPSVQRCCR